MTRTAADQQEPVGVRLTLSRFDYNPFLLPAYAFALAGLIVALLMVALSVFGFPFDSQGLFLSAVSLGLAWFLDSVWLARLDDYLTRRAIARRLQQ